MLYVLIVLCVLVFALTCRYARWEERIDRRRRERAEERSILTELVFGERSWFDA